MNRNQGEHEAVVDLLRQSQAQVLEEQIQRHILSRQLFTRKQQKLIKTNSFNKNELKTLSKTQLLNKKSLALSHPQSPRTPRPFRAGNKLLFRNFNQEIGEKQRGRRESFSFYENKQSDRILKRILSKKQREKNSQRHQQEKTPTKKKMESSFWIHKMKECHKKNCHLARCVQDSRDELSGQRIHYLKAPITKI